MEHLWISIVIGWHILHLTFRSGWMILRMVDFSMSIMHIWRLKLLKSKTALKMAILYVFFLTLQHNGKQYSEMHVSANLLWTWLANLILL